MQIPINQQILDLTIQLEENNKKLYRIKSDKNIKALLKRNDILVQKRKKLAKQLGLTSWESVL
jgi:hypothetical protein